jgi:hypothetical protein
VKLVMRFGEVTDGWPFMYHCHNLLHEDNMMMLQYIVQDPSMGAPETMESGVVAYPSPTTGLQRFDSEFAVHSVLVRDAAGRVVLRESGISRLSGGIDISGAAAGPYLLELFGDTRSARLRFLKE